MRQQPLRYQYLLLIVATYLGLVACMQKPNIKDYRTKPNDYYKLITNESPCKIGTYYSPETSPFAASSTFSLSAKSSGFIEEYRSNLPAGTRMEHTDSFKIKGMTHLDFEFFQGEHRICNHYIRFHLSETMQSTSGNPLPEFTSKSPYAWPEIDLDELSKSEKLMEYRPKQVDLVSSYQCLKPESGELVPVTKISLYLDGKSYKGEIRGQEFTYISQSFFTAEGQATVYKNNESDLTKSISLKGLQDNIPYLCSNKVTTSRESREQMAYAHNHIFNFKVGSPQFGEVSAFTNTTAMIDWFTKRGLNNWSVAQIDIILDTPHSPQYINPEFDPGLNLSISRPTIVLPDTLGDDLENIHEDVDAVSHELAHHYLYKFWPTGSEASHEHFLLHEGISDFFVAAKTKDSCIGNRICLSALATGPSAVCESNQCLRNANNSLKYKDDLYYEFEEGKYQAYGFTGRKPAFHKMSQVASGVLWNLHAKEGVALDKITTMVIHSLPFTNRIVELKNFINTLMQTSKNFYPQYQCKLLKAVKSKGLDSLLKPEFLSCPQ